MSKRTVSEAKEKLSKTNGVTVKESRVGRPFFLEVSGPTVGARVFRLIREAGLIVVGTRSYGTFTQVHVEGP